MDIFKYKEKLLDETEIEEPGQPQKLSEFFREKGIRLKEIEDKRDPGSNTDRGLTTLYPQDKIAKRLDISVDQFHQKIYRKKPLTRDWLIAICAAYGLGPGDTDDALSICGMPRLDDSSTREIFFNVFLEENKDHPVTVQDFNNAMIARGVEPLNIVYREKEKNTIKAKKSHYKQLCNIIVRTYGRENEMYASLTTDYLPDMRCIAEVVVEDVNQRRYILGADSYGTYSVTDEDFTIRALKEITPEDDFFDFFMMLSSHVRRRKQKMDDILNDSRNYLGRWSANLKNDKIHVFYEEYNYRFPERNEYLMMEYVDGQYRLSIAHKSMFMSEYLSKEEYREHYHMNEEIKRRIYHSLVEIDEAFAEKDDNQYPSLYKARRKDYSRLKEMVSEKLDKIKNREVIIQVFENFWDNPYDVLSYYNIEEPFGCQIDEKFGDIYRANETAEFMDGDGETIVLSFDDIRTAFEYGVKTIEDICRLKKDNKQIEDVIF